MNALQSSTTLASIGLQPHFVVYTYPTIYCIAQRCWSKYPL